MSNKRIFLFFFLFLLFSSFFFYLEVLDTISNPNPDLLNRRIETIPKKWLNGYLGAIFNFRVSGIILWLLLPLLWLFRKNILLKYLDIFIVLFLSLLLIGFKGYINDRYQFSLLPILYLILFSIINAQFQEKERNYIMKYLLVIQVLNFTAFISTEFVSKYLGRVNSLFLKKENKIFSDSSNLKIENCIHFINALPKNEILLSDNLPEVYYYSDKKAIFYIASEDLIFSEAGKITLIGKQSFDKIQDRLKNEFHCTKILTLKQNKSINLNFESFLNLKCQLVAEDEIGRQIYQIH